MQKLRYILSLLLCATSQILFGQESQTAYNFLRLPVSAHAAALGGDNITIIEDDASFIFSNPALLSSVSDKTIALNYMNYMKGANTASASFNRNIKERASVAISGQFLDYGKIKETTSDGQILGDFSARDISLAGYFSYMLGDKFAGGIATKFIASYLGDYNSIAMGVDLGGRRIIKKRGWSASFVVKNLGGQLRAYNDHYDHMPIDVQVGVTKRFAHTPFRVSATLVDLNHWGYRFINHAVVGLDALLSDQIWLGAGYNFRRADEMKISSGDGESSHMAGLSFGAGLNMDRFKINLAYGKYHVSASSIVANIAFTL